MSVSVSTSVSVSISVSVSTSVSVSISVSVSVSVSAGSSFLIITDLESPGPFMLYAASPNSSTSATGFPSLSSNESFRAC